MFIDRTDENPFRPLNGSFCFAGENYTWMNLSSAPISVYAGGAESTKRVRLLQIGRKNRPAAQKRRIFGDRAPGTGAIDFLRILLYYKSSCSSGRAVFPGAKGSVSAVSAETDADGQDIAGSAVMKRLPYPAAACVRTPVRPDRKLKKDAGLYLLRMKRPGYRPV